MVAMAFVELVPGPGNECKRPILECHIIYLLFYLSQSYVL
jgi:hypothetical protein